MPLQELQTVSLAAELCLTGAHGSCPVHSRPVTFLKLLHTHLQPLSRQLCLTSPPQLPASSSHLTFTSFWCHYAPLPAGQSRHLSHARSPLQEDYIKEEQRSLKRELLRSQEEVKRIQSVPLVIGQFLEMVDSTSGIVGSTTGSNYYVRILSTLNRWAPALMQQGRGQSARM